MWLQNRRLTDERRENIDENKRNMPQLPATSTTSSGTLEDCSFPVASRAAPGSEAGSTIDADRDTSIHNSPNVSSPPQANPPHFEPATESIAINTMDSTASYADSSTQVVDVPLLLQYADAWTQTTPSPPASPPYAEAYTQTRNASQAATDMEVWERQLEAIRRETPLAPIGARPIVVKCPLREPQDTGSTAAPSAMSTSASASVPKLAAHQSPADSRSSHDQQRQRSRHDNTAPVVVDLLSSSDEDEDDEEDENDLTRPPRIGSRKSGGLRVGGGNGIRSDYEVPENRQYQSFPLSYRRASQQHVTQHRPRTASGPASSDLHNNSHNAPAHGDTSEASIPNAAELERRQAQQRRQRQRERAMEAFYGMGQGSAGTQDGRHALRYQDPRRSEGYTALPDPMTGTQLRLRRYLADSGTTHRRDVAADIAHVLKRTSWGVSAGLDEDSIETRWWSGSLGDRDGGAGADVIYGFPLIERVRFLAPANHGEPSGDCYWRAVAAHMYGGDADGHWDLVKAEHLSLVYHVLTAGPAHPRYALYAEHLNVRFFDTESSVLRNADDAPPGGDDASSFKANLWQVLHMAHAWTPALMQQVTADVYGVCLVTFSIKRRTVASSSSSSSFLSARGSRTEVVVTETTMRGSYNARHIFLLYDSSISHFQPLLPADHIASECQYPRPSIAATARYSFAPRARKGTGRDKSDAAVRHAWRREFTPTVPPPIPRLHGCHIDKLRGLMGSRPRS